MPREKENTQLKVTALSVDDTALLLSKVSGRKISAGKIKADIRAGAPTNRDGSLSLIHYAAWLIKELNTRGD